ncbi:hypothetical protein KR018_012442 [Drosophila ironensis]|nr:hypothetical protein KR018_012442 [Drosophila ironensis]
MALTLAAWFNHLAGAVAGAGEHAATAAANASAEVALRRRLQADADVERDGSDSSCSESVGGSTGSAIRPTSCGSPKEAMVGGGGGHESGRTQPGLLFCSTPSWPWPPSTRLCSGTPTRRRDTRRCPRCRTSSRTAYSLPGSLGSAFDAVTPGSNAQRSGAADQ